MPNLNFAVRIDEIAPGVRNVVLSVNVDGGPVATTYTMDVKGCAALGAMLTNVSRAASSGIVAADGRPVQADQFPGFKVNEG